MTRTVGEERTKQFASKTALIAETGIPTRSESRPRPDGDESERLKELELRNRELETTTRAKDQMLALLERERGKFHERLIGMSRYVGELETQLLQLGGAPRGGLCLPQSSEAFGKTSN